jgi:hypothetical protein
MSKGGPQVTGNGMPVKMEEADALMKQLEEISFGALWRQTFKEKEISARLTKAVALASDLGTLAQLCGNADAQEKAEKLVSEINHYLLVIPNMAEVVSKVQAQGNIKDLMSDKQFIDDIKHVFGSVDVDSEAVSAVSMQMGSRLLEDLRFVCYALAILFATCRALLSMIEPWSLHWDV